MSLERLTIAFASLTMAMPKQYISYLVAVFVVIDLVSLALSLAAEFKLGRFAIDVESYIATLCNAVPISVSILTLLFVSLPTRVCMCLNGNGESYPNCCTCYYCNCCTHACTYYVSIVVAASLGITGTVTAGILQIFSITNYEEALSNSEASSLGGVAAAFNFSTAIFGVITIVATIIICMNDDEWEENWSCGAMGISSFILITVLLVASLVAGLLTIFFSLFATNYPRDGGNSNSSDLAGYAALFSGGAAACLLVGFCGGGAFICATGNSDREYSSKIRYVRIIWACLVLGTIVAGGLMMKVGQNFSSGNEELTTVVPLNRGSIAAMGYLIGGLNFVVLFIACFMCCCCYVHVCD